MLVSGLLIRKHIQLWTTLFWHEIEQIWSAQPTHRSTHRSSDVYRHYAVEDQFFEFGSKQTFAKKQFRSVLNNLHDEIKIFMWSLASARIRGLSQKKRLNARGFAREFLRSGMLYRPGKSLKRRGKSSSLHSKKHFLPGGCGCFVSDVISGGLLGPLGPLCLALGANR